MQVKSRVHDLLHKEIQVEIQGTGVKASKK